MNEMSAQTVLTGEKRGEPKYLLAMSYDITERKRSADALRSSQAMFGGLMAASPDAVFAVDGNEIIVLANERVRDVYGHDPAGLVGRPSNILSPPDTLEDTRARMRKALATVSEGSTAFVEDLLGLHADGT
ncbi:MAG: PAS domain S-box protein, partial [Devosia sp.]|nr:PAS domain S-box protein [Devosia sp.]